MIMAWIDQTPSKEDKPSQDRDECDTTYSQEQGPYNRTEQDR